MPHIAIVNNLLTGRLYASFELASRLQLEGHTITYLCQPRIQQKIEENGFTCFPVSEITFTYQDPRRLSMQSGWFKKLLFHFKNWNNHYSEGKKILKIEEHKEVLRKVNPDLILIDYEMHDFIFTAFELKIPTKLTTDWFSDKISVNSPSVRTSVIPGEGLSGTKMGIVFSWFVMRTKIYGRVLIDRITFENYRRSILKKYAQEIGFDTSGLLVNTLPPPYSFKKLPIMAMSMSELEFPHKLAKNFTYIGPMVYENRLFGKEFLMKCQQLEDIYRIKSESNKKLIYCSVGSLVKGYLPFLKKVIDAVANVDHLLLIMSIGPKMNLESFEYIPNNAYLYNWVPQLDVLKNSDCYITHCGIGSIHECIHLKVPMLLYSSKYVDQNGCAARMSYHGLGIRGDIAQDSSTRIKSNIETVLTDEMFKVNMNRYHRIYLDYKARPLTPLLFDF